MHKDNIPVPVSTLVLMIVTIAYKLVLVILGITVLALRPDTVMFFLNPVRGWCYLGLALNIIIVVAMLMLIFHPTLMARLVIGTLKLLELCHIIKNREKLSVRFLKATRQYNKTSRYLQRHKLVSLNVLVVTIIQRGLLFFITWLIYRSFGLNKIEPIVIITLQGMISVAVDMLPLPGGMGISEKLFLTVFAPIFGKAVLPGLVLSRGISYYTLLILSAIMTAVAMLLVRKKGNTK
jgi:hypothetical protein